ncbi:MAG: hypothetical protein ACXABN_19055 [Candidatus Thorarchaeota archaeon]
MPITQRTSQTITFTYKLKTFDVEIFICTGCYMNGGLSKRRKDDLVKELCDAQDGARW